MKKARILTAVILLVVLFFGGWKIVSVYSESKDVFQEGTTVNGIDVRGMDAQSAKRALTDKWNNNHYELTKDGEVIAKITDFDYEYDIDDELSELVSPNPFSKLYTALFKPERHLKLNMKIKGVPKSLSAHVKEYKFLDKTANVKTKDAHIDLRNTDFKIVKEVYGDNIDKDRFISTIKKDIAKGKFTREYKEKDFYALPEVKSDTQSLLDYQKWCEKNLSQKIKFNIFDGAATLTPKQILTCYDVDKDFNKKLNEKGIEKVAWQIANAHNTRYKNRKFVPHGSKEPITIWGGDYGWVLDQKYTAEKIEKALKSGGDREFDMEYDQKPYYTKDKNDDIGKTYVEISIGSQALWLVKDGKTVFTTDIVSGRPNHATPLGAYFITQKVTNTTLRGVEDNGKNYESKVSYWMPFNGGIGCHDAHWRNSFGGSIYRSNGSHGCVNLSTGSAASLFSQVEVGMPVIVHE